MPQNLNWQIKNAGKLQEVRDILTWVHNRQLELDLYWLQEEEDGFSESHVIILTELSSIKTWNVAETFVLLVKSQHLW